MDDDWWIYETGPQTMQVIEEDREPVDTGLVDSNGPPIYRVHNRVPIGFHRWRER